jgi:dihydrofolate reductase
VQHIYIDGGTTIQSFLRDRLIDELTVTRVPVLIGEGISLFGPTGRDIKLRHISTRTFPSGWAQSKYGVDNAA